MKVISAVVVDGKVELPAEAVAEGAHVMILAPEASEPIRLTPEQESELLESMEQIRRGDYINGQDLLRELRSRHGA